VKVELWFTGKTKDSWVTEALTDYLKRCQRFGVTVSSVVIPESRNKTPESIRKDETARIITSIDKASRAYTVLLDEAGNQLTSVAFSELISRQQTQGVSTLRFVIGGAFGVDPILHRKVDYLLSLSSMTFPHQLVRAIFAEQLYRAFTILRREGYHHE